MGLEKYVDIDTKLLILNKIANFYCNILYCMDSLKTILKSLHYQIRFYLQLTLICMVSKIALQLI
jgi:hypothetical protein